MAKLKTKSLSAPAAQSRDQVENLIARAGEIQRELQRQAADLGDRLAEAKREAETTALPLKEELEAIQGLVQRWCEANRETLTRGGRIKTAEFTTGKVFWRVRPPSVTVRGGVEALLIWLKANMAGQFIRTKEELDRAGLQAAPEIAATIPGVRLGSAGEDFVIEPFGGELAEAV